MDVIDRIQGKQGMVRPKCSENCKGCNKKYIYQRLQSGNVVVRPFEGYHWICRVCKECNRKALITENNSFIYVDIRGFHNSEYGGCVEKAREITRDEIDRQFFCIRGYYEREPESIFE